jgi:hypothetical protein
VADIYQASPGTPPLRGLSLVPEAQCPQGWSTFGPHAIGAERCVTVSSGTSLAQVASAILAKQARVQNPDKTPMAGGRHEG